MRTSTRRLTLFACFLLCLFFVILSFSLRSSRARPVAPPKFHRDGTRSVAVFEIPEKYRFRIVGSITNSVIVRQRDRNGHWQPASDSVRSIQWNNTAGYMFITDIPNAPWQVELHSIVQWKLKLGPFLVNLFSPETRLWRSQELPARSTIDDAPLESLTTPLE